MVNAILLCEPTNTGSRHKRYSSSVYRMKPSSKNSISSPIAGMMKIGKANSKMMMPSADIKRPCSLTVKRTELCLSIKAGIKCRYGDACKFVHDRSKLPTTLNDLVQLNQIKKEDVMTYRNRPCFDFVSTGTCPFGHRCTDIHPPKVHGKSDQTAWLKNIQFPDESIETDVHVDYNYHGKSAEIKFGDSSLGPKTSMMWNSFESFSSFVSNATEHTKHYPVRECSSPKLSHSQRLHIACLMTQKCQEITPFKYKPTHVIRNNLCMIVQKRVFRTNHPGSNSLMEEVESASHHRSRSWSDQLFVVREILFAHPSSSQDVQHPHGLWINTPSEIIYEANLARVKSLSKSNKNKSAGKPLYDAHEEPPFHLYSSTNPDAQELITNVLWHMCSKSVSPLHDASGEDETKLMDKFTSLSRVIKTSHWPVGETRDIFNLAKIPVVPIDAEYRPRGHHAKTYTSFLNNLNDDEASEAILEKEKNPRLGMFQRLAEGGGASLPPHDLSCGSYSSKIPRVAANSTPGEEPAIFPRAGDWEMVLRHKSLRREILS